MSLKSSNINTQSNFSTEASEDEEVLTAWQKIMKILQRVVESRIFEVFTIFITIQSMFSDDIRIAIAPLLFDVVYNVLVILNILMFIFEIIVSSVGKKDYFLTFYFFTDIIATMTLVFDFGFLFDMIVGITNFSADDATDIYEFAKDGKHLRKGTKAFSLFRIIRLIKLLRIIKLYKHIHKIQGELSEWRDSKKNEASKKKEALLKSHGLQTGEKDQESRVGKRLSDLTTRRVIILVLVMLCSVPFFSVQTYKAENTYYKYGPELLSEVKDDLTSAIFNATFDSYITQHKDNTIPLLCVRVTTAKGFREWNSDTDMNKMRATEKEVIMVDDGAVVAVFSFKYTT